MIKPYRGSHFLNGYVAEFLPIGQRTWRMLRANGEPLIFPTQRAAAEEAEREYLRRLEPTIRATIPVDQDKLAAKLAAEAEDFLRSSRADKKKAEMQYRPGKKPFLKMPGRAA